MSKSVTVLMQSEAALHDRYERHMLDAERAAGQAARSQSIYWGSLWAIKRGREWQAKGYASEEAWLRDELLSNEWAPSRATYKGVMTAIADWQACGADEAGVLALLANRKVATEGDLRNWFVPGSDHVLRPEVRLLLASRGETPLSALTRISQLPAAQARAAAGEVIDREYWLVERDSIQFYKISQRIAFTLRHEHNRKGLLAKYNITIAAQQVAPTPAHLHVDDMPPALRQWLLSKFGQDALP